MRCRSAEKGRGVLREFKLANIVLEPKEHIRHIPEMLFRAEGASDYSTEDRSLAFDKTVDFLTYFNSLSAFKWKKYTSVTRFKLHLELAGDACAIRLVGIAASEADQLYKPDRFELRETPSIKGALVRHGIGDPMRFEGAADYTAVDIEVDTTDMVLVGFELESEGATAVRDGYWYALVEDDDIRPIRLALATTTFKNEHYILPNIEAVRAEVLACDDPVADGFHMFVVDNGRTLDARASGDGVTIIPNANVGGSGGFARGMIAALEGESLADGEAFTHVLLMDDDVSIFPESIKRTFNLLSLANDAYEDAFVNGAMIQLENPNIQFEDVAFVMPSGTYGRIKGNLFVDRVEDISVNELIDVEVPNAYGAWWYACIPVSAIQRNGLPLPIFVRCDDVEYGIRSDPTYMTMNGICVWHAQFDNRFRASVDCYQYIRNYLVMMAVNDRPDTTAFMMRANRLLLQYLRQMGYETSELIVAGLEDYLKGPEFLMESNGEALFKQRGAENEKLLPLDDALEVAIEKDPSLAPVLQGFEPDKQMLRTDVPVAFRKVLRLVRTLPYDKHLLPENMLRVKPGTAYYGGSSNLPGIPQTATKVIVACDRSGELAHVRVMDKKRDKEIRRRWRQARRDYRARKTELEQAYRDALPQMTSVGFWHEYLERALEQS